MKKLALCAGHYYGTEDRRCLKKYDPNETREWTLNDRVADRVEKLLASYEVEIMRMDDTSGRNHIPVQDRTKRGNEWGADFWLGIHHNAGINGGKGGGITAYVYTRPDSESLDWQKKLYDNLIYYSPELKGNRATPLAKGNLAECRDTDMPSVLLELGFMDSSTDIPIIITEEHADKCAKAIVETIVKKWNLTKREEEPETEEKQIVVYYGGSLLTLPQDSKVYDTSDLVNKIGTVYKGEKVNMVCRIGNSYGIVYDISRKDTKKIGFIKM